MARTRNLKPSFFKNETLAELGPHAMLLYAGMWTLADREGRLEYRPKRIKAEIFPYFEIDIEPLIHGLSDGGFIVIYQVDTARFIAIPTWLKHQAPHLKEQVSTLPAPGLHGVCTVLAPGLHGSCTKQESPLLLSSLLPSSLLPSSLSLEHGEGALDSVQEPKPKTALPPFLKTLTPKPNGPTRVQPASEDWGEPDPIEVIAEEIIASHPHSQKMNLPEFVKAILSKVQAHEAAYPVFVEVQVNHRALRKLDVEMGGWLNGSMKFKQIPSLRDWVYKSRDKVSVPVPVVVKDWVG